MVPVCGLGHRLVISGVNHVLLPSGREVVGGRLKDGASWFGCWAVIPASGPIAGSWQITLPPAF